MQLRLPPITGTRLPFAALTLAALAGLTLACSSSNNNSNKATTIATRAPVAATTVAAGSPTAAAAKSATPASGSATAAAGAAGSPAAGALPALPAGGNDDPKSLVMAFVPSRDVSVIQLSADKIAAYLSKELNRPVKSVTLSSYAAVTQALSSKTADIGWVGPLDYLIGHEQNGSYPVTCSLRPGDTPGSLVPGYKAFIITKTDSGINTLADLKGKSFAFGDTTSASSSLVPKGALIKAGINPDKDLKSVNISNQSAIAIAVYQGKADAGAIYNDARTNKEVKDQFPDILDKTKVIYTSDLIPCDPQIVRKDLTQALAGQIRAALLKYSADPEGKTVLNDLFSISALGAISDSDYDGFRNTVKTVAPDLLKGYPSPTPAASPAASPKPTP
ncbi:MAG TPA: phosphate/phosphite/phosphonate ABC transporter substrate-binding protein [Dehalococcoidia bacterium]|nr:phosphate/phosphite/phosphonate ABC transporter substrate-binding protein [Dehalococcoidia bacterium]